MTAIEPSLLYTPAEVAGFLRCGKTNVYDLIERRDLAVIRVGASRGGMRVMGSDILAFLEARKEGGPSPKGRFKHLKNYVA